MSFQWDGKGHLISVGRRWGFWLLTWSPLTPESGMGLSCFCLAGVNSQLPLSLLRQLCEGALLLLAEQEVQAFHTWPLLVGIWVGLQVFLCRLPGIEWLLSKDVLSC